ncbi:MAG: BASS family bile acid:Na+ symporter [Arenicella sp.]|jgi:BASS family bile acid:Na+ symporter
MEKSFLTSVILPISLAVIMLGMGLSLRVDDFKRVFKFPKAVLIGTVNQIILLPLLAWALISLLDLDAGIAIGLIILSVCPGGTTSNLISHVSKGDTALSVTLTAISTCATFFTIPIIVNLALAHFSTETQKFELPITQTIGALFLITILPISIGMTIKKRFPNLAEKLDKPVRVLSVVFFAIILAGITYKVRDTFFEFLAESGLACGLLLFSTLTLGFFSARFFKLTLPQSITISIETGIQNGTLGLLVATQLIPNALPEFSIPSATYGLMMFIPAMFFMMFFGKRKRSTDS